MFKMLEHLILASGSPRRKDLLLSAGIKIEARASRVEESFKPEEADRHALSPDETTRRWAFLKAYSVSVMHPSCWILGADTIVVLDGCIFGKPSDSAEAVRMLGLLSNREHDVITGMCLLQPGGQLPAGRR